MLFQPSLMYVERASVCAYLVMSRMRREFWCPLYRVFGGLPTARSFSTLFWSAHPTQTVHNTQEIMFWLQKKPIGCGKHFFSSVFFSAHMSITPFSACLLWERISLWVLLPCRWPESLLSIMNAYNGAYNTEGVSESACVGLLLGRKKKTEPLSLLEQKKKKKSLS